MRIELTLLRRANHRGENLLAGGAVQRSVATADFSSDHGGPQRLLGPPIGRVDPRRLKEEREEGRPLDREMRGESTHVRNGAGAIELDD